MKLLKGLCNILGILLAWVLSIALVIMLIVSPVVFSALSLLTPQTVTELIDNIFKDEEPAACAPAFDGVSMHGSSSGTTLPTNPAATIEPTKSSLANGLTSLLGEEAAESILDSLSQMVLDMDLSAVEESLGVEVTADVVEKVIHSDVAVEVITPYIEDLVNVFVDKDSEKKFTEEKIVEVVEKNLDEIVELIRDANPELSDKQVKKLKIEIQAAVSQHAGDVVNALPKPEDVKAQIQEELADELPEMEEALDIALEVLADREKIDLALMAVVALLALLVFICRIPGLRGFRWLSTILLIAGIMNGLLGGGLYLNGTILVDMLPAEMIGMRGIIELFIAGFAAKILKQAGIMLVAALAFSLIYHLVKKRKSA